MDEEIELLRKEKSDLKEYNEELTARASLLANENPVLTKQVNELENDAKASEESLEEYKKRVKALADES
ncbi:hypothetical protein A1F94_011320 [Pyrenophora tritici-repentis]|nr:hypothetical protein PtrV1_03298 [Pyrenophora tritici-repentis]KAF7442353.1 hypothetical protein A1F99_132220 [Pyrenophora tritici-repentis]KAG9378204.1 hypothetical protein A1F94_011320 [Pyrenophora tritici-repentis]KAI1513145.1 hypothetical protein Ptr86124_008165 [Pyrenophora tritici-repentis]KAI1577943.1 TBPIP multi-domain protein [Pyrenophora tritici-repentis]